MRSKPARSAEDTRAVEPFVIADTAVAPGATARVELRIARLPAGAWMPMSVLVVHGKRPGPTVWVNAAVHGDELNGVIAVRRLLAAAPPQRLRGTLLAVPVVNVFGVTIGSRYLPDRRDLNRSFPGARRGSLAGRLADLFFESVVARCSVGVDYHTGSGGRFNLPQIRCNVDDLETMRLAHAFGAPLILHAPLRQGTLRAAASKRGIRMLVYEAGEAGRLDSKSVSSGVHGMLRVLQGLDMLERAPKTRRPSLVARESHWLRAPRSGFWVSDVKVGKRVRSGQVVGMIVDAVGLSDKPVVSRESGLVIGLQHTTAVHQGDAIVHVARIHGHE